MAQSCHLAVNLLLLLFFLALTHALSTQGGLQFSSNSGKTRSADYIVSINSYLLPESLATLAEEAQRWWKWRWEDNGCGRLLATSQLLTEGGWQDFVVVRVVSAHRKRGTRCVQEGFRNFSVFLPRVGRISVTSVVEDVFFGGNRALASVAPRKGFTAARPLYPRRYFGLSSTMKWTGRGVRIALLDTGLDSHLASSSSPEQQLNSEKTAGAAQPLRMCTSFVPGLPCENNQDGHGTFSVSVMAGNISFLKGAEGGAPRRKSIASDDNSTTGWTRMPSPRVQYLGIAPGADVHMLRVFDDNRDTRTSWCVAALNFALQWNADVISLSFGGNDYYDVLFTAKVTELAKKGLVVVAATGNEGPEMGSLHNPADQTEVIAVGSLGTRGRRLTATTDGAKPNEFSIDSAMRWVSTFSGRGPSKWEMPYGAGRVRPDLVALGEQVLGVGRDRDSGALSLRVSHGTSVATPIVAGIVALCIDALRRSTFYREADVNVAMMKRILMETAVAIYPNGSAMRVMAAALRKEEQELLARSRSEWWRLGGSASNRRDGVAMTQTLLHYRSVLQYSYMSQGAGEVCPMCALAWVEAIGGQQSMLLRGFVFPREIDATGEHQLPHGEGATSALPPCLANWPYCEQPLFPSATPVEYTVNLYHPRCPAARLLHATPRIRITGAKGICGARRRGRCHASTIDVATAKQLLLLRAHASHALEAHSGVVSLFALSPSNASSVRRAPSPRATKAVLGAGVSEKLLGYFDLIEVSGSVEVAYTCNASSHATRQEEIHGGEVRCNSDCVTLPFKIPVIPRPPRAQRMAFDISHQWFYPPDFVPGDDAYPNTVRNAQHQHKGSRTRRESRGVFECDSDHPYTNMVPLLLFLRRAMGLFVEVPLVSYLSLGLPLGGTATTSNLHWRITLERYYRSIGTLLLLDPELPLVKEERGILAEAVLRHQLHVVIISEWYSERVARELSFHDVTRNQTWSPLFLKKKGDAAASSIGGEVSEHRTQGLKGACHVPSLNAFLCDISQGTLQLDDNRVVDGALTLATTPTFSSWYQVGWGRQTVYRHFGQMRAAGVLRWPPARNACSAVSPRRGHVAGTVMVCGMEKAWARELREVTRAEEGRGADGSSSEAADVLRGVHPKEFAPLFGFVGVGNSGTGKSSRRSPAEAGKALEGRSMGRVAVFTDTSGFSSPSSLQASLRILDKLVSDASSSFYGKGGTEVDVPAHVRDSLATLVTHESENPSFAFSIVREFVHFLYTGDLPEFTGNSECRSDEGVDNAKKQAAADGASPVPASTTPAEGKTGSDAEDGGEFEILLSTLFAAAPRRVALAHRLREVLSGWETVTIGADGDCSFRSNEAHVEEKSAPQTVMGSLSLVCASLFIAMLMCVLLRRWSRGRFSLSGILGCDKGDSTGRREKKKGQ
ncbi:putative subtilisin-like serine peptidase [Trypanosoma conorhini]|uniref:Putative subtilisin-like serine peptidase n=1 Tax=Trypanosoma conorhini TaxID=83891 RepID=A0A3R7NIE7_9TRYP|nr:putative subtilisin-like serine peptidase [Trypanosoma conorhini]RNF22564.1 putative subtilisin-like serine peptidase [Trypanosoma conorhini]